MGADTSQSAATTGRPVLVVGCGVAGSALAIGLARAGIPTEVVDIAEHTDGAAIGLVGRAVNALEELGVLADCVAESAVAGDAGAGFPAATFDQAGRPLPVPPPPPAADPRLPAALALYRPVLAAILWDAARAAGATRRIGVSVRELSQSADRVDVTFTDGTRGRYQLVVGADGFRSAVRDLVVGPEITPVYTGHMSLRWLVREPPAGPPGAYTAPGTTVTVAPLRGGLLQVATGEDMPKVRIGQARARAALRDILGRFSAPLLVALRERLTEDQQIVTRPFDYLLVPPPWHRGRVVLAGDAVHLSTSHLSYGGGMALEDAVVLVQELLAPGTVEDALDRYAKRRFDRVRMIVEASVGLLRLQQRRADYGEIAALRSRAVAALAAPY